MRPSVALSTGRTPAGGLRPGDPIGTVQIGPRIGSDRNGSDMDSGFINITGKIGKDKGGFINITGEKGKVLAVVPETGQGPHNVKKLDRSHMMRFCEENVASSLCDFVCCHIVL
jgi:hypothetical protein